MKGSHEQAYYFYVLYMYHPNSPQPGAPSPWPWSLRHSITRESSPSSLISRHNRFPANDISSSVSEGTQMIDMTKLCENTCTFRKKSLVGPDKQYVYMYVQVYKKLMFYSRRQNVSLCGILRIRARYAPYYGTHKEEYVFFMRLRFILRRWTVPE